MSPLLHQRIIANAGSGKTYRLTTRYIELLARGIPPERIIALTFTRKAAGEFLDAIFARLLSAAEDHDAARKLATTIGFPDLSPADFRGFLRLLIQKLPQLALGTLDGFFGRIIRVFPFECGLAGPITILDAHLQDVTRRTVLAGVFRAHSASERSFRELLDLLRRQSRNRQSRSVMAVLDTEVSLLHEKYLLTPRRHPWGDRETIWPDEPPFRGAENLPGLVDFFERAFFAAHEDIADKYREGWTERFAALRSLTPGGGVPKECASFALKALHPKNAKQAGQFELKLGNKIFALPDTLRSLASSLGCAVLDLDLDTRLERSRALYDLLAKFEAAYEQTVRAAGQLTFLDITGMLAAASGALWAGKTIGRSVRLQMDYRLDASYDHWLLDEFQDTSRLQWQALRDLVDEVIQSDSGERSFFYVGDTKQAIYSWRGGDPTLFDEIAEFYNSSGEARIDTSESLDTSYRSAPLILDGVNLLFAPENLARLADPMDFPLQVVERWRSAWRTHQPSGLPPHDGCIEWRTYAVEGASAADFLDAQAVQLLSTINPAAHGWTCAVLVHTNQRIGRLVNALRAAGLSAAAEGRLFPCTDNEFATGFLALLRFIAHPEDSLARAHVRMTPLDRLLDGGEELFRLAALQLIRERAIAGAGREWLQQIDLTSEFLRHRAEILLDAAAEFDASTGRAAPLDEFVEFAEKLSLTESGAGAAIRVMTMHTAKGLDFDMVVLPEIEGVPLPSRRDESSIHLHLGSGGRVQWGLELPPRNVCEADPMLSAAYEKDLAEDCYEKLCLYYVALTRARRGLYLLSSRQKKESKSHDFNRLLHLTLPIEDGIWQSGNPAWHQQTKPSAKIEAPALWAFPAPGKILSPLPRTSLPSASDAAISAGEILSSFGSGDLGTEVHTFLSRISWINDEVTAPLNFSPESIDLTNDFLASESGRKFFTPPPFPHTLWREKAFDVLAGTERISGIFDRVVIADGAAQLFDFKTDRAASATILERHRPQMELYRRALAALLAVPPEKISAYLVCLREGKILPVE